MEALIVPFALFFGFIVLELCLPGRAFPRVGFWKLKGVAFFLLYLVVASFSPLLWTEFLGEHRLVDATSLGTWWGALVGILAVELFVYTWHRTMHSVPFLWRWFHQMHHSAERIDVFGAFYFHPLDMVGFTLMGSLGLVWAVGITPEAAGLANLVVTILAIFQHTNVKTPAWLGYFVQRPESHSLHHQRDVHGYNYADLPIFDILFGTFRNPATWDAKAGLYDGASSRIGAMLIGRDLLAEAAPDDSSEARDSSIMVS
jgi:sterol desaturase/sphingolipid hydroxylase (fatty acid hydroxylase superfamily)